MFDWSDIRFFLELHRLGTLASAGRKLGVDQTTVSRRIHCLENAVGASLFHQSTRGYLLSEAGLKLLPLSESMESIALVMQDVVAGSTLEPVGTVRIGMTEGLGTMLFARHFAQIHAIFPKLDIELVSLPRFVDMSNHEADIAIGQERPTLERLVTLKIAEYALRLYASPAYLAQHEAITSRCDLSTHRFIGYIDDLVYSRELHYVNKVCPGARIVVKSNSIIAQLHAAESGAGIAILPCFMVSNNSNLLQVMPSEIELRLSYWMTTRSDLLKLARVRAIWDYVAKLMLSERSSMLGAEF